VSASTVITEGYGSFGSIALVVTQGYGAGVTPSPEPEVEPVVEAVPDNSGGLAGYMEEFARERMLERRRREDEELLRIIGMEEEMLRAVLMKWFS
jgi:hypothetical protein